ncbi:hypothetical protein ACOMHN_051849 [Nucella lapillus]
MNYNQCEETNRQTVLENSSYSQPDLLREPRPPERFDSTGGPRPAGHSEDSAKDVSFRYQGSQPQTVANSRPPFTLPTYPPPPLSCPSYMVTDAPYPGFPVPFHYPPHGFHTGDFTQRQTNYAMSPAGPGLNPPPQGISPDTRSWLPPTPAGQCAQQLMNLASQLMSTRDQRPAMGW